MSPEIDNFTAEFNPASIITIAEFAGRLALTHQSEDSMPALDNLPSINVDIREYQAAAWQSLARTRQNGDSKALVHLATGLGKTTVAVIDALRFINEYNEDREEFAMPKILFACHQNSILEQASERFAQFAPDIPQGFFNGDSQETKQPITFATMQSLHQNLASFDPSTFDYIIYDEAHHSQAKTFKKVVKHFSPIFQLALTATPDRMDGKNIRDLFGKEIYKKSLEEALSEGWLADVDYHIVFDEAVKNVLEQGFDPQTLRELYALFDNKARNQAIADQIHEEMERIGLEQAKTIVFCQDIEQANEMAALLGGQAYHSDMKDDEQKAVLDSFRSNGLQVITTRDMFNEGVDVPDARLLIFLRSTGSRTIFEQQLGRGLRKHPGKEKVSVLDFVANVERLGLIKEMSDRLLSHNTRNSNREGGSEAPEPTEHGLSIHTMHGDFDFNKIAINVLQKMTSLSTILSPFIDFSQEDIVELALSINPESPLTAKKIDELSQSNMFLSTSCIKERFGSIYEFQEACGFTTKQSLRKMSNEALVELGRTLMATSKLTRDGIDELSKKGLFYSSAIIRKRFGSIKDFQEQCGYGIDQHNVDTEKQNVIHAALTISPDSKLTAPQLAHLSKEKQFVSIRKIRTLFGSIKEFQKACGFDI